MSPAGRPRPGVDVRDLVGHDDPAQLLFQMAEIVKDRTYLRHGIEAGPGDLVFDVGANVGVAAAFFVAECGVERVHSFEPVPPVVEILERNLGGRNEVTIHPFGLSDAEREAEFTYYERAAAMSSRYADPARDREAVKAVLLESGLDELEAARRTEADFEPQRVRCRLRRLSDVIAEHGIDRIDLLKIDVERAELDVLRGIDDRDWPAVRQVAAEVHDEQNRLVEIRALLESRGFTVVIDQEESMARTDIRMLYAKRD